jgi:hypothetical protein
MTIQNYSDGFKLTLVLLVLAVSGQGAANTRHLWITDADRAEIINRTLEPEFAGQEVNDRDDRVTDFELMMKAKGGIVLSAKNIKRKLIPRLSQFKLLVLQPREIQEKADREGDFLYLLFSQFDVKGSRVVVTLNKVWARAKTSNVTYMSGGRVTYEYRKVNGRWVRKFLKGYVV